MIPIVDKEVIDSETLIDKLINKFMKDRGPLDRYTSFDYCYNYFQSYQNNIRDIAVPDNLQVSCLHVGFYLASWGMLRGSSFLLQRSIKHYEPLIKEIAKFDKKIWSIDVDSYTDDDLKLIFECYEMIKRSFLIDGVKEETIITKIMLRLFGCVPAFDQNFCDAFRKFFKGKCGFRSFNTESLKYIREFYHNNKNSIDKWAGEIKTVDFATRKFTNIPYSKAKIIDMIGFTYGIVLSKNAEMKNTRKV